MRLIFTNRFYWPETPATGQLLTDLAEYLAANGHEVSVIASHSGRADLPRAETRRGVRILRIRTPRSTQSGAMGKAFAWCTFYLGALIRLWRQTRRGVIVVAMTDPPMLGIGAWFVTGFRGAKLVQWTQDIYPEVAIELTGHRWLKFLLPLRNYTWRHSAHCITLGAEMAAVMVAAGVASNRLSIIHNAAPVGLELAPTGDTSTLRREWDLEGKFVVSYSGNLGRVHDLFPVLDLADALRGAVHIVFAFIGGGPQREPLEQAARARGLNNVRFYPPQPREKLQASLSTGDLHLVTLRPGCEHYVFPSKFYGIAAVGRPALFIGPSDSELARIIVTNGLGLALDRDDINGMATAVTELAADSAQREAMSEAARRFAGEQCIRSRAQWREVLQSLEPVNQDSVRIQTTTS